MGECASTCRYAAFGAHEPDCKNAAPVTPEPTEADTLADLTAWFEQHLNWETFRTWDSSTFADELAASTWLADLRRAEREQVLADVHRAIKVLTEEPS